MSRREPRREGHDAPRRRVTDPAQVLERCAASDAHLADCRIVLGSRREKGKKKTLRKDLRAHGDKKLPPQCRMSQPEQRTRRPPLQI